MQFHACSSVKTVSFPVELFGKFVCVFFRLSSDMLCKYQRRSNNRAGVNILMSCIDCYQTKHKLSKLKRRSESIEILLFLSDIIVFETLLKI